MDLKEGIIEFSRSVGFDEIRFAKYKKLEKETDLLKLWLNNGYNADMKWIEKHLPLRDDPKSLLESCESIIVFAHSYNNGIDHLSHPEYGKIARYAFGRDYHKVLKKKLKKVENYLQNIDPDLKCRYFVDSGPVAERDWASISGLGARGKNSLILNKKLGSYFFLSVMLTNLKIEPDDPIKDMCGNCTKCLDACPTNAIVEPYIVDSNKCISYQTIENRDDDIPTEISKNQSNWIFGCDICQEVCPWNNHRNKLNDEPDFRPRDNRTQLKLTEILEMDEPDFYDNFAGQAITRAKINGLKRNSKSILDNSDGI